MMSLYKTHVLTGTDQEFYFALQGIDMYAGK
jgi:hypothetical protein